MHIINIIVFKQTQKNFKDLLSHTHSKFYYDFVHFHSQNIRNKFNATVTCDFQLQKNMYEPK